MELERTYIFKIDKYIELMGECDFNDNFNMRYEYINKVGQPSTININIKTPKKDSTNVLLGNNVESITTNNTPFGKIMFNDQNEYINFVRPEWLEEFDYIR